MIVDNSSNYHVRLNTDDLSCTIISYYQLSRSLDVLKFDMIIDDSFSRLIMEMIVHDGFFRSVVLPKTSSMQNGCRKGNPIVR